jgi:CheY-like chemotaxis protein
LNYSVEPNILFKDSTILIVDDDVFARTTIARFLGKRFKEVFQAGNGLDGLAAYNEHHPDIVVSDIEMPKMNGLEMVKRIKAINADQHIIVATAYNDDKHKCPLACRTIIKPISYTALIEAIESCFIKAK